MEPGGFGTQFGTGGATLAATGGTDCDESMALASDFPTLSLYSGGTGETHWDAGTLPTDQKVGGSNFSERAKSAGHGVAVAVDFSSETGFATICHGRGGI